MPGILIWAETRDGEVRKVSREAAGLGRILAEKRDLSMAMLVINDTNCVPELSQLGCNTIYLIQDEILREYSSEGYARAMHATFNAIKPDTIIIGATAMGRDLAARLSARIDAIPALDVVAVHDTGTTFTVIRPVYSGKLMAEMELMGTPRILTIRPNVFPLPVPLDNRPQVISLSIEDMTIRTEVREAIKSAQSMIDVTEAEIIVSGGRGTGGPDGFALIEDFARSIGGAMGASRVAVDSGWVDYKHQVGQTGKVVSPVLYIACGISGTIQHFAGMGSSKYIIAINKDPDAPIMKKADFAIVGDLFKVVPILKEELRTILKK